MRVITTTSLACLAPTVMMVRSLLHAHPDARVTVGVIDAILPDDVDLATDPRVDFASVRDIVDPRVVTHFIASAHADLFSLGLALHAADALEFPIAESCYVLAPTLHIGSALPEPRTGEILLFPRRSSPLPADQHTPALSDLIASGSMTDQLVGFGAHTGDARSWLRSQMKAAPDVPWLDYLPESTHPRRMGGRHHAWSRWNADESSVLFDDSYLVDAEGPVPVVDMSGFDPHKPWLLSAADPNPRVLLSEHPEVARWCAYYATEWQRIAARLPPACEQLLAPSVPLDRMARTAYLRYWNGPDAAHEGMPRDLADLALLLRGPDRPGSAVTRFLRELYESRADLREAIPGVGTLRRADAQLAMWARRHGRQELGARAVLVEPRPEPPAQHHLADSPIATGQRTPLPEGNAAGRPYSHGVNLVGYLAAEFGLGTSARLTESALTAAAVPISTTVETAVNAHQNRAYVPTHRGSFGTTLMCVNADHIGSTMARFPKVVRNHYVIAQWFWELEDFPQRRQWFENVDEIWAATHFMKEAIGAVSPVPVVHMPIPLSNSIAGPAVRPDSRAGKEYFLFCFDYASVAERKNPLGVIDAFSAAFSPRSGPSLVIKTISAQRHIGDAEKVRLAAAGRPDIEIIDDYLPQAELATLMAGAIGYVSLHRSEGLGLTIAQSMALGVPVIATAYSGNLDFTFEDNSFLVPWRYGTVPPGLDPYPAGARWAEPDLDAAVDMLRLVYSDRSLATERAQKAQANISDRFSPEVTGGRMRQRLIETSTRRRLRRLSVLDPRPVARQVARTIYQSRDGN